MNEKLLTVGEIAARTGLPIHRVQYLIKSRRIEPSGRAGVLRVFDENAFHEIEREVAAATGATPSHDSPEPRGDHEDGASQTASRERVAYERQSDVSDEDAADGCDGGNSDA